MNNNIHPIMITKDCSIRKTMQTIDDASSHECPDGLAIIIDESKKLIGIVTDGDLRRAIVKNVDIESSIKNIMVTDPVTVNKGMSDSEMLESVSIKLKELKRNIGHIIIVDDDGQVDDVINFFELWESSDVKNKDVLIIGLGHVGLTLALVLADVGFKVSGYEIKTDLVKDINKGIVPFHEKGLSSLLKFHLSQGNFRAIDSLDHETADIYIFSVGTPLGPNNQPILSALEQSSKELGPRLKKRDLVILRSTVIIGTTRNVVVPILEKESGLTVGKDFHLVFAPERTVEGNAIEELRSLPQVIGGFNQNSLDMSTSFFSHLNPTVVRVSSLESAEMIKLISNSFRDLSFAFANEMACICGGFDLDAVEIINAANEGYPRNRIAVPSPGVGGVCLKKDPYLYYESSSQTNTQAALSLLGRKVNEQMPLYILKKIENFIKMTKKQVNDIKIFIIGFAFKGEPETSDMRDSTTLEMVQLIKNLTSWEIFGYDPIITKDEIEKLEIKGVSLQEGFQDADCVLIMNNHRSYGDIDILGLLQRMKKPALLFDGWHLFPLKEIERIDGISYEGLSGRN